jgi:hypothetical protein
MFFIYLSKIPLKEFETCNTALCPLVKMIFVIALASPKADVDEV